MAKIVFFGTPDYVLPVLEALHNSEHEVVAVVTQPSKPVGRKQILTPSPVSEWAKKNKIQVFDQSPKNIIEELKKLQPEAGVLASYGKILPKDLLDLFPKGILNIHPSLLPQWRGPSPIEAQMVVGTRESGISFIKLDEEMDHGPIVARYDVSGFHGFKNKDEALNKMFAWAAKSLPEVLTALLGGPVLREQKHEEATYTTLLNKEHGFIPPRYLAKALQGQPIQKAEWKLEFLQDKNRKPYAFSPSPYLIGRLVATLNPWPGTWTEVAINNEKKRLKILEVTFEELPITYDKNGWDATEHHKLVLTKVQLEGKNPVSWKQFRQAYPETSFED